MKLARGMAAILSNLQRMAWSIDAARPWNRRAARSINLLVSRGLATERVMVAVDHLGLETRRRVLEITDAGRAAIAGRS